MTSWPWLSCWSLNSANPATDWPTRASSRMSPKARVRLFSPTKRFTRSPLQEADGGEVEQPDGDEQQSAQKDSAHVHPSTSQSYGWSGRRVQPAAVTRQPTVNWARNKTPGSSTTWAFRPQTWPV